MFPPGFLPVGDGCLSFPCLLLSLHADTAWAGIFIVCLHDSPRCPYRGNSPSVRLDNVGTPRTAHQKVLGIVCRRSQDKEGHRTLLVDGVSLKRPTAYRTSVDAHSKCSSLGLYVHTVPPIDISSTRVFSRNETFLLYNWRITVHVWMPHLLFDRYFRTLYTKLLLISSSNSPSGQ